MTMIKPYKKCKKCGALIVSGDLCEDCKPMTNADRIRQMTDEELADKLTDKCAVCAYHHAECEIKLCFCEEGVLKGLKQDVAKMPELIDKQASMKAICDGCFKSRAVDIELKCRGTCNVSDILQQQPTIEAEPVRHGRWIEIAYHPVGDNMYCDCNCSNCNFEITIEKGRYPKFCENCGARMDGGADNGNCT